MTSEKIKTVSVNHHLLPVLRFRSRVWDMLCLIKVLGEGFALFFGLEHIPVSPPFACLSVCMSYNGCLCLKE